MAQKKKKKKKSGEFPIERVAFIGGGTLAALVLVYFLSYFVVTESRMTKNDFVTIRTRVCFSKFAREFYRPLIGIERRLFDLDIAVEEAPAAAPPPAPSAPTATVDNAKAAAAKTQ